MKRIIPFLLSCLLVLLLTACAGSPQPDSPVATEPEPFEVIFADPVPEPEEVFPDPASEPEDVADSIDDELITFIFQAEKWESGWFDEQTLWE